MLASGGADRKIVIWQYETSTVVHVLTAHTAAVRSIAFAPTNVNMLVSGGDDAEIRLCDAAARVPTRTLHGHTNAVNSVAWSRGTGGDAMLASGSQDGSVIVWAPLERKTAARAAQPTRRRAQPSPPCRSVSAGSTRELCLICLDRKRGCRLRPCLHVVVCETCVLGLIARGDGRCPTCRAKIKTFDLGEFNVDEPASILAKPTTVCEGAGCATDDCTIS